jgi:A/G-specific adenine glycosylase
MRDKNLPAFRRRLLGWFRRHGRRLPWRGTHDPYRIWVSEIMLQQTRVAAATKYYSRFLKRFPTAEKLARARISEVLRFWAGMGYYRRARQLHKAARIVAREHNGKFPNDFGQALALPGIGRYTAAAILSIAYSRPYAVVDGNVGRVLARLGAWRDTPAPRDLERRAQEIMSRRSPGEWNQAMMELGATVCLPRRPQCLLCPAASFCKARALEIQEEIPPGRKKREPVDILLAAGLVCWGKRFLVVKQADGLFGGQWQFPLVEVFPGEDVAGRLRAMVHDRHGLIVSRMRALEPRRHAITFRRIRFLPFLVTPVEIPAPAPNRRWAGEKEALGLVTSSAMKKMLDALRTAPAMRHSIQPPGA